MCWSLAGPAVLCFVSLTVLTYHPPTSNHRHRQSMRITLDLKYSKRLNGEIVNKLKCLPLILYPFSLRSNQIFVRMRGILQKIMKTKHEWNMKRHLFTRLSSRIVRTFHCCWPFQICERSDGTFTACSVAELWTVYDYGIIVSWRPKTSALC